MNEMNELKNTATDRESQTQREFNILQERVKELGMTIELLEKRLYTVLALSSPEAVGQEKDADILVPIADSLRTQRRIIQSNIRRINLIVERLEI